MSRVYITGKWSDKDTIREYMNQLEKLGHTITHDWTTSYESNAENKKSDIAFNGVQGVAFAEVVIVVLTDPKYSYRGSFTELGVALGLLKDVYVICHDKNSDCRTNVFFHHPSIVHVESWGECLSKLKENGE